MTTEAPDIFADVEAALPEGWYICRLERIQDAYTGEVYWGAAAECEDGEDALIEEVGTGDTPALALRAIVQALSR